MPKYFKNFALFFLLCFLINISFVTYAKNNTKNDKFVLSEKYNPKEESRIKNSIKQKNEYRFLIYSTGSLDEVKNYFINTDKKVKVKKYTNDTFMIRLSSNSTILDD